MVTRKKSLISITSFICVLLVASAGSLTLHGFVFNNADPLVGVVAGRDWLSQWSYRKAHNVTGSTAGDQFNYPIALAVHYNSGYDYGGDVYLNGKCRGDFGDIRFTDSTGSKDLNYWIEQKVDNVTAIFWVKIDYIPQSQNYTTIYIYYGNPNATTTSNKDWTFQFATDFEDGTTQGWTITWSTYLTVDGVTTSAFEGNYSRIAGRAYGTGYAGIGHFYERFRNTAYLSSGSYLIQAAAAFSVADGYIAPQEFKVFVDNVSVASYWNPRDSWHLIVGNFTMSTSKSVELDVEFHLLVSELTGYGTESYSIDSIIVRRWCDPEPTHGTWGVEQTSYDNTPPQIFSVAWIPTCPIPFTPSLVARQAEPIMITSNVSDEIGGSGVDFVQLCCRVGDGEWWNTIMTFNATQGLWIATIPGQRGNTTISFYVIAHDKAGNVNASSTNAFDVKNLAIGDINGDGIVDIRDITMTILHFQEHS
jgi:hypothetical protein